MAERPRVHVKICGVRTADDAVMATSLGASAIGVNFVAQSPRRVSPEQARTIARAVKTWSGSHDGAFGRPIVVGVVADLPSDALARLVASAELDCLQLHGDESPDDLAPLLPHAYKAVRIAGPADVTRARSYPGDHLLVDAKVDGVLGGSGATFDWSLVADLARERRLTLAGGLTPENVADAIRVVRPYCVDVASGVERSPGVKDEARVRALLAAVAAVTET